MLGGRSSLKELITVQELSFRYQKEERNVLDTLDLSVYQGEWLAIVGHNGSGKSTLAKLLNGLLLPTKGKVIVEGYDTSDTNATWEIRTRVGIVFQNPDNQFVGTTVRDDVAFGLENNGVPREEMVKRIDESIAKVGMMDYLNQEPHQLSGGQKQRVAIAGIIAQLPSIMILDEATSMLDPIGRKQVLSTVRELNQELGITVISITHDLEEAVQADRIVVMNQGRAVKQGCPEEVFQEEELLQEAGLDLPFSMKLRNELINSGIPLSRTGLTQDELVNELWTLRQKI
jgi:energy-coupling factor transport system ATP-binding protein